MDVVVIGSSIDVINLARVKDSRWEIKRELLDLRYLMGDRLNSQLISYCNNFLKRNLAYCYFEPILSYLILIKIDCSLVLIFV
jgi:hypothetical protein